MKWILPLLTLAALSSCTTKPYMVGSVNEQFYTRYRTPGAGYKNKRDERREYDYTHQQHFIGTARLPIFPRRTKHVVVQEQIYVPPAAPYTSSK
ncbi:hypothetical protein EI77_03479 [Prosthecobacter fusiformis]|uniref:Lipoprotein n=1 Tax=Prosthecobacter fusiformis TaxID=48464 RepID=A0A4R7RSH2_9BACT|nr:hypothetical protein [Prosthecobacter fusiformis]TDU67277.1 hypothetical protein EI77_03479 [Prosthecobacter fusiformis]